MTCRPGHAAKHPDYEPGNTAAEKHGAREERRWRPSAEADGGRLADRHRGAGGRRLAAAVEAWSIAEAKVALVGRLARRVGVLDGDGSLGRRTGTGPFARCGGDDACGPSWS